MKRRVVVTGLGVVTSLGRDVETLWTRVCNGQSGVWAIQRFDTSRFRVRFGGEIRDWSTEGYLPARDAKRLDEAGQLAKLAVDAAKQARSKAMIKEATSFEQYVEALKAQRK